MSEGIKIDILSTIDTPADLRKLSVNELPMVCQELRNFIIDACSSNPGHFGSSMGAVELTVALHYVFNTPYDRIVWDVGHQAYGHKILTGRRDRFKSIIFCSYLYYYPIIPTQPATRTTNSGYPSDSPSRLLA